MKYTVEVPNAAGAFKAEASFAKRSQAVAYANGFDNVQVRRKTDQTNRIVFSRKVTKNGAFITVTESETTRASK